MIGSRLLFSGYGDGKSRRPLHAGLLGQDSWIVLDEAHLTPAFAELLLSIKAMQQAPHSFSPFRVSLLSATQRNHGKTIEGNSIIINPEDTADPLIGKRLAAKKSLRIHQLGEKDVDVEVISKLASSYRDSKVRVLVYLRSPKQVTKVADQLNREAPGCPVRVLTGTLRGLERDELAADPVFSGFRADPERQGPEVTHYLVSTSAGEVGADLDADHLVCDIVPLDSLIQRLGRVNRLGMGNANVDLVVPGKPDKEGKNVKVVAYLKSLPRIDKDRYSVSPADLINPRIEAFSEEARVIPLARHWLDMWSQTSIHDDDWPGRPEIAPWLHGVVENLPETHVAWRDDVRWLAQDIVSGSDCARVFEVYDIRPHEHLREPTGDVRDKLIKLAQISENDLSPVILLRKDGSLAWRGRLGELLQYESKRKVILEYSTVLFTPSAGGLSKEGLFSPTEKEASDVADHPGFSIHRCRYFAKQSDAGWDAGPLVVNGSAPDAFKAENLSELISIIAKRTGYKLVASVQLGGHGESEADANRYLLYFTDKLSAAQSASVLTFKQDQQPLADHVDKVGSLLGDIARRVGMSEEYQSALNLAGCSHDTGKNRRCWQRAIGNTDFDKPLAKSGRTRFNQRLNDRYRHEFGSLIEAAQAPDIATHPHRDLILHLIASHHGHARPHYNEEGFDKETALGICQGAALETMQRFGRLQARYGWWTLAWLESLLKAGDVLVSGGFVEGGTHG
jgi:CRISPR-associated endonuclease/helicase Cas3